MNSTLIAVTTVKINGPRRTNLGDLAGLAASITAHGLLHPITVITAGDLVAGQRRLEACRRAGLQTIPAYLVDTLDDAAARLHTEPDGPTGRLPMTPEEKVNVANLLYTLPRDPEIPTGAREVISAALGWSGFTLRRARKVVAATRDTTLTPDAHQAAVAALTEMNATGRVNGAYEKVTGLRAATVGAKPAGPVIGDAAAQRKAITGATTTLSGMVHGLNRIGPIHPDITPDEAAAWAADLAEARRVIAGLTNQLKERINEST